MQLSVYVLGREVATLEQSGDFKSVLTYHPHVAADDFVSLTMPVRLESYVWDDQLPPVLQMNLPEGYLDDRGVLRGISDSSAGYHDPEESDSEWEEV